MCDDKFDKNHIFIDWSELNPNNGVSEDEIKAWTAYFAGVYGVTVSEARAIAEEYLHGDFFGLEDFVFS